MKNGMRLRVLGLTLLIATMGCAKNKFIEHHYSVVVRGDELRPAIESLRKEGTAQVQAQAKGHDGEETQELVETISILQTLTQTVPGHPDSKSVVDWIYGCDKDAPPMSERSSLRVCTLDELAETNFLVREYTDIERIVVPTTTSGIIAGVVSLTGLGSALCAGVCESGSAEETVSFVILGAIVVGALVDCFTSSDCND